MSEASFVPARNTAIAGIVAIAAAYVCFLLFVGLAFIDLTATVSGGAALRPWLLAGLGGGGMAGSLLAVRRFELAHLPQTLGNGFRACGVAAALAFVAQAAWVSLLTAVAVGVSLGWLAVTLAVGLRSILGTARLGRYIGIAIGGAHALCHLPWILTAGPRVQVLLAGAAAVIGALAAPVLWPRKADKSSSPDYAPHFVFLWIAIFLALVALAAATAHVILHSPALKAGGWSGWGNLGGAALVALVVALFAGRALDHGWLGGRQAVAFALLAGAVVLLDVRWRVFLPAQLGYAAGVSFFSTALVYYAARSGRPLLVGVLFAVAGWGGSLLGLGLAQGFSRVPYAFLLSAGLVVAVALGLRTRWRREISESARTATLEHDDSVARL